LKEIFYKIAFLYPRLYAFFCYYRKKEQRREFEEKVRLFCPESQAPDRIQRIVRGIFELRGSRKLQRYLIPQMGDQFIKVFVTTEGLEYLDQALKEGRGILLMAPHIGNPHIGICVLRLMGYEITIIKGGKPRKPKFPKIRYSDPHAYTVFTEDTSLSKTSKERIFDILKSGRILYYSGDASLGKRNVEVSFLGKPMLFPTGTLHLAREANAIVFPFIHLYRRGKIQLILKERMDEGWIHGEGGYRRIIEAFATLLESYIHKYPEEYMGFYGDTVVNHYYRSHRSPLLREGET
jgi:lauroyl/myristoyl acyltransferase